MMLSRFQLTREWLGLIEWHDTQLHLMSGVPRVWCACALYKRAQQTRQHNLQHPRFNWGGGGPRAPSCKKGAGEKKKNSAGAAFTPLWCSLWENDPMAQRKCRSERSKRTGLLLACTLPHFVALRKPLAPRMTFRSRRRVQSPSVFRSFAWHARYFTHSTPRLNFRRPIFVYQPQGIWAFRRAPCS